jgi:UDP-4-amino-4,6-dideoxy-N-acetyl-beta-L-altrosamine N-acetyltransferase
MKNPFLIGAHIYLRPLDRDDAALVVPWINDPKLRPMLRTKKAINVQSEIDFIDRTTGSEHDLVLGIVLKENDRLIGLLGFHEIDFYNRHCVFGISVGDKEFQNQGHGSAATRLLLGHAFETMNLNRVELLVYEYNERAIRAYTRIGFKKEGVLRQENYREGRYWDTWVMAILREEWLPAGGHSAEKD